MKKLIPLLLTIAIIRILSGCAKTIDDLNTMPGTPDPKEIGTPVGGLTSKTIGNDGGSIISEDGNAELIFPSGALAGNTEISIQAITNNAPNGIGMAYRLLPEGTTFIKPVTVKFHYGSDDLASTLSDLMGIVFQNTSGSWIVLNDFTNDTAHLAISCPITHFTDFTVFDLIELTPRKAIVKVEKTIGLTLSYVEESDENGFLAILPPINPKSNWAVNGIENGNPEVGTLSGTAYEQIFKAPSNPPSVNPVVVSAEVPFVGSFEGKHYNNLILTSRITIRGGERYFLGMSIKETTEPFIYKDSFNMIVNIDKDNNVTFTDIHNFPPTVTPPSATIAPCTATWKPDAIGETNVIGATGTVSGLPGDPERFLQISLNHTGAISPTFTQTCEGSDPETNGGVLLTHGLPFDAYFTLIPDKNYYEDSSGDQFQKLVLLE